MVSLIRPEETILWAYAIQTEENFNIVVSEQDTLDLLTLMLTLFAVGQARQHTGGQGLKKRTHSSGRCTLLGGAEPQRRQLCTLLGEALLAVDRTKTITKLTPNGQAQSCEIGLLPEHDVVEDRALAVMRSCPAHAGTWPCLLGGAP